MANQPRTRQEIYDRIRESSKDEFILKEMIRLGFWPAAGSIPQTPGDDLSRRAEIERELKALQTEQSRLSNATVLKQELHKRRLAESRRKQQETKDRREREKVERAEAWKQRKSRELVYLGEGVSGGLSEHVAYGDRLARQGLPSFEDATSLALAMGLSLGQLRALAFSRTVSESSHYVRFTMPKKSGGVRQISAPMPRLKKAQRWVLDNILARCPVHEASHGFRPGRSIVSNASPHVGAEVVVNLDLRDFFPSIGYRRVRGVFRSLGYDEAIATVFALLTTEPEVDEVTLDGRRYFVARGERRLPQGAPTSPAITNLICRRLDRRLTHIGAKLGFRYTRYADDLTFSAQRAAPGGATPEVPPDAGRLLRRVRRAIDAEGLVVHPAKTRILRRSRRQEVTGVVVNEKLSIDRETLRRFRALVFQLEKDGPAGKRWGDADDVLSAAVGYANFVAMVTPDRGVPLREKMKAVMARWRPAATRQRPAAGAAPSVATPATGAAASGPGPVPPTPPDEPTPPQPEPPKKKWWKLF
jgi:RNA-directed DNA polymerase